MEWFVCLFVFCFSNGAGTIVRFPITRARLCATAYEILDNRALAIDPNREDRQFEFAHVYRGRDRKTVREELKSADDPAWEEQNLQLVPLLGNLITVTDVRDADTTFLYFSCEKVPFFPPFPFS